MSLEKDHYLKTELYDLVKSDDSIFEFLQSGSLDGIWYWNLENPDDDWLSPEFKKLFGYQDHEMENSPAWWQSNMFAEDYDIAAQNVEKHFSDPDYPNDTTVRFKHRDGSTVWVRCRGLAIRDEDGTPIRMLGAHTDVTDLKRTEEKLKQSLKELEEKKREAEQRLLISESKYEALFKQAAAGIGQLTLDGEWLEVNERLCEIISCEKEDLINQHLEQIIHPHDLDDYTTIFSRLISGDESRVSFEKRIINKLHQALWLDFTLSVVKDDNEEPLCLIVTVEDITVRKEKEIHLIVKERYYRQYFELGLVGMAFCSKTLRFLEVNSELCHLLGYSKKELEAMTWDDVLYTQDRDKIFCPFNDVLWGRIPDHRADVRLLTKGGDVVYVSIALTLNSNSNGLNNHVLMFICDRTQEALANQKLEYANYLLNKAESIAKVGSWNFDIAKQKINWSAQMWQIFEQPEQEVTFEKIIGWVHPDYVEYHHDLMRDLTALKAGDKVKDITYPVITPQGQEKWVQAHLEAEFNDKGDAIHLYGVLHDITESYQRTQSIENLNRDLRRSNEELERFAYIASHDLKAPLRAIKNLAGWINEDLIEVAEEDTKRHLSLLQNRVARMEGLLDGLLQYSRVGRVTSDVTKVNLGSMLDDLWSLIAAPESVTLELDLKISQMDTYKTPLLVILTNLLGNAIKHMDQDLSRVTVSILPIDQHRIEVSVLDDGPGIESQYHEKIFELFQSLKPRDEVEGSGLGLSIVKKTVEQYGGTIEVESDPNISRGTKMTFLWPIIL